MNYFIMNKETPMLEFEYTLEDGVLFPRLLDGRLPDLYNSLSLSAFLDMRSIAKRRYEIKRILKDMGLKNQKDILDVTYGLSLTDTFWIKPTNSSIRWQDINLYDNPFNEIIGRISILGDRMLQSFKTTSPEFGTDGMLPKCWVRRNNGIFMLKGGTSGTPSMGREPISEYLVSQLEDALELSHVSYALENYHNKLVSCCPIMTNISQGIVPFSIAAVSNNYQELILNSKKYNVTQDLKDMLALDVLTGNNDRHLSNIQLIYDNDSFEVTGLAPIFDNGQGLCNRVPEIKFNNMKELFSKRMPALYDDFNDYLSSIISEKFYNKLKNMRDFEFTGSDFIAESELNEYNRFIQWRIADMVEKYENSRY